MTTTKAPQKMLRQVTLRTEVSQFKTGYKEDVCWIDNELAKKGKRLRGEDGGIWVVVATHNAKPFEDVDKQREAWKRWADVLDGH